jgi:hypothetical protein
MKGHWEARGAAIVTARHADCLAPPEGRPLGSQVGNRTREGVPGMVTGRTKRCRLPGLDKTLSGLDVRRASIAALPALRTRLKRRRLALFLDRSSDIGREYVAWDWQRRLIRPASVPSRLAGSPRRSRSSWSRDAPSVPAASASGPQRRPCACRTNGNGAGRGSGLRPPLPPSTQAGNCPPEGVRTT